MSQKYIQKFVLISTLILVAGSVQAEPQNDVVPALVKSKLTLKDGIIQVTKAGEVAISAKFEFDDNGKLSLSIYTAAKGLSVAPEDNILQELAGSPEQTQWKPEVEVFKDVPHVARASEQLVLFSLTRLTLLDVVNKTQKNQPGTVFSITPGIKQHKPVAVVLVANNGKVTELTYNLNDGALIETRHF